MAPRPAPGHEYILTLSCPDTPGLVYAVSSFLVQQSANIRESQQFDDPLTGRFFMRVRFSLAGGERRVAGARGLRPGRRAPSTCPGSCTTRPRPTRTLIMVSQVRPLPERPALPRQHRRAARSTSRRSCPTTATSRGWPPPTASRSTTSRSPRTPRPRPRRGCSSWSTSTTSSSSCWRATCRSSPTTCARSSRAGRSTSTTRSCPSFKGAKPYHQAHARGVKLIGATAHYVTAGPRRGTDHRAGRRAGRPLADPESWSPLGRDVEAQVLARAVHGTPSTACCSTATGPSSSAETRGPTAGPLRAVAEEDL